MTTYSTNDFRNPLLRALGDLSNHTPLVAVPATDVYDAVIAAMGIPSLDAHGDNKSGKPQVIQWIQWANKDARKAGHTTAPDGTRGKWMLTADGVQEALRLAQADGVSVTPTPVAPVATATLAPVTSLYHTDSYLRGMAINVTPCFGHRSPHGAAACATCALQVECRHKQLGALSDLAVLMESATVDPASKPTTPSSRFKDIDFKNVDIILNKAESVCIACGQTIGKEERCRWVEELPDTDDGALFHLDCSGGE
jgi:hypothetical protein